MRLTQVTRFTYDAPVSRPRHPENCDRTARLAEPLAPRPAWECSEWWLTRAHSLPEQACGKCADHGACTVSVSSTRMGRTLAYHCRVCGWLQVMLVQEGQAAPAAPATELPPVSSARAQYVEYMRKLARRGANGRWEKVRRTPRNRPRSRRAVDPGDWE